MRRLLETLCLLVILLVAPHARAQDVGKKVSFDFKNESLPTALKTLNRLAEGNVTIIFAYDDVASHSVTASGRNMTVEEALRKVLTGTGLTCTVQSDGRYLSVRRQPQVSTPAPPARREEKLTCTVVDENGEPLVGANITVKYDGRADAYASVGMEGHASLPLRGGERSLTASFVGYLSSTQAFTKGRTAYTFRLEPDTKTMSEVVVTGIFKKQESVFTGAALTITKKELDQFGDKNLLSSLANIDPAFNIVENNNYGSDPNRLPDLQVRGTTSITALQDGSDAMLNYPLIIMDGFEITLRRMLDLNPEEVESVTLLKDGAATAIYGSRGANGIIVITSREPEEGRLRLSYNGQMNVELPDLSGYHLLDARRKLELEKQLGYFEGSMPDDIIALSNRYASLLAEVERGVDTDWLAKPLRAGIGHRHALRIEGGDKAFRYAADVSADFVNGVMKGSGRRNYNGGITLNYQKGGFLLSNRFLFGYSLSDESPYGSFADYVKLNPYWTPTDENGAMKRYLDEDRTYWGSDTYFPANPLYNATLPIKNTQKGTSLTDNLALEYRFSPAFTLRGAVSLSKEMSRTDHYLPRTHTTFLTSEYSSGENVMRRGRYDYGNTESTSYTVNLTLNYNKLFGGRHLLYLGVNGELSEQQSESVSFELEGFTQEDPKHLSAALSYAKNKRPGGSESTFRRVGVVANANYSLSDTYYVDGAYRVEGASQFGANKRFAPFYSIGAGWNLHRERWMQSVSWVSYLKLRLSYGQNGSQRFSPYQAIATYNYLNADRYHDWLGIAPAALENEDLEWQITDKYNVGVEASFFKARVNLTADVYCDVTDNLLTERTLPLSNGFTSYSENLGKLRNVGFEAKLSVKPIVDTQRRIIWTLTGSVAHNKSKMVKLSSALKKAFEQEAAATRQLPPNRLIREGEDLNTLYAVRSLGIDPQNGREVYVDRNGELTYTWSAADLVPCGVSQPKFRGNLNSTFRWGNFSCALAFGYHFGGQQYNETLVSRVEVTNMKYNVDERVYTGRWKQEGDVAPYKGLSNYERTNATSRFVQDDRMLTLRNVNLAYEFREQVWMKALGLTTMQVSANLSDVFYLSSIKRERGLSYPFARRGSLALSLMF